MFNVCCSHYCQVEGLNYFVNHVNAGSYAAFINHTDCLILVYSLADLVHTSNPDHSQGIVSFTNRLSVSQLNGCSTELLSLLFSEFQTFELDRRLSPQIKGTSI